VASKQHADRLNMTAKIMFSTRSQLARLSDRSISFAEFRLCLACGRLVLLLYNTKPGNTYGVPHIFVRILASPVLLVGQMQSHGDLLLRLYGQRGRATEY